MTTLPAPAPAVNPETREFWDATTRGRLLLKRCLDCGSVIWYPRAFCPECASLRTEWFESSGRGHVYSYTVNHRGQGAYADAAPYVLAYVELDEGPRVMTNLVETQDADLAVGLPVEVVFHDTGEGTALPRFRPRGGERDSLPEGNEPEGIKNVRGDSTPPQADEFRYEADAQWEKLPPGIVHKDVSAVDTDSQDRVYLLTRFDSNVLVYEPDGTFVTAWGGDGFTNPHGLTVGPDDSVWTVDNGDHTVRKFTPDGKLLLTLGRPGKPSDTGRANGGPFVIHNVETVLRPGEPFNACTNLAVNSAGRVYVADGYGNCRIHAFSPDGELLLSWGEVGVGPGEFHLPHGIGVGPDDRVYVCDRENDRIQIFDPDGRYLAEWTDVQRPCHIAVDPDGYCYVAELWRPKGKGSFTRGFMREDHPGRVTIFDRNGAIVARWGASTVSRTAPGNFIAPHGIAVDSRGDLYVAEVSYTFGARQNGVDPAEAAVHQLQKFTRVRASA